MKVKLGDIFEIGSGGTPSKGHSEYYGGNIPWVKTGDLKTTYLYNVEDYITEDGLNNSSAKIYEPDTVLIAMYGATIGATSILKIDACTNQACAAFKPNNKVKPEYLYYFLRSKRNKFINDGVGGAQPNISAGYLKKVSMELPILEKQKEIIDVLNRIVAVIEMRKQELIKLDDLIKARFVELFGDPEIGTCNYSLRRLGDLSNKISDGVHAKPEYVEDGRPFLSVVNINKRKVDFTECKYVSEEAYQKMIKSTHPEKGDVLYTKVGATYGIPAYVDTDIEFCLYVSVCLIKPKHDEINARFLALQMDMPFIKHQADSRIKGIGVPDLHLNQIREFLIICPPREMQNKFVLFVEQVDKSKFVA